MEKFQKTANKWIKLQNELRKECIEFLEKVLKANGNHLEWDDTELDASVCVTYDGGNHPEYASNAFSTVTGIDLNERGEITLDIEDDSEYDIENITTEELYDVCDFVDDFYFQKNKNYV